MSAPEPRSVLAHAMPRGRHGAGGDHPVSIRERRVAVVQLQARKGREGDVATAIRSGLGLELPPPGRATTMGELTAIWIQPGAWLLLEPWREEGALMRKVDKACHEAAGIAASLVDQTGGKAVLRVSGRHARAALAKGCRVDLNARVFKPGSAAVTPIAHVNVVLAQADDAPSFDLVLPSSFAGSFTEWLLKSAGEFGYVIE